MIRNENGNILFITIIIISIFVLLFAVTFEWYRVITISNSIDTHIERGLKISMDMSVSDEYRKENESFMDIETASEQFYEYLYDGMMLNEDLELMDSGSCIYKLNIDKLDFIEQPPQIFISGYLEIEPEFFKEADKFIIKFSKKIHNVRLE